MAKLGVYGLARFLRVYRAGAGDYTRDRHQWLDGLTVEELAREFEAPRIESTRLSGTPPLSEKVRLFGR